MKKCKIDGCDRKMEKKNYCGAHYQRVRKGKLTDSPIKRHGSPGSGYFDHKKGYKYVSVNGKNHMLEHRYVMEQHLGRKLLSSENIHHINGVKHDNRIENLELWSTSQPSGQRIEDKIKYAKEILEQYENLEEVDDVHYW